VSLNGKFSNKQLGSYNDSLIEGLKRLSSSIHETGTPVVLQINHAGSKTNKEITGLQPIAPSSVESAREIEVEEMTSLVKNYVNAADRAIKAGFDGVEVHGAHGFLLNQFFSPLSNKRKDEYGGSFENRMKFPLEVVKRVKEKVGKKLLLYRLGSIDLDPTGIKIEDSKTFALNLEKIGVDILDVSGGLSGSRPIKLKGEQGYFVPQAHEIRKIVNIPVIGVGGITEPSYANDIIEKEYVDLVAVGRQFLKDPEWAVKALKKICFNSIF
jgi:2,4-dienoyl-CoA reductase-like NADH-dependent reductase (Old Yellow Enzyme family)